VPTLAWRRRYPVAVAIVVCALNFGFSATAPGQFPPQLFLIPLVLAVYAVAAHTGGRTAWLGAAMTLALIVAGHAVSRDGEALDFLPWLVWGASWFAGSLVRRRTLDAAAVVSEATLRAHRQEEHAREAAARERDRIARELHDVVAHAVSLVVVQAGAERLVLGADAPRTRAVLDAIENAGRQALVELRAMLAVLRSPDDAGSAEMGPQPGLDELPALAARVRDAGLPIDLDVDVPGGVPPGVGLSAYRIVQEALTNALKHAPTSTHVEVHCRDGALSVEVRNPLVQAADQVDSGTGRGLVGMRERAMLHGGEVHAGVVSGMWVVRARLPLPPDLVAAP
jgi:signal transduction histidine kinase